MPHVRDSAGRLTTAEQHEAAFSALLPTKPINTPQNTRQEKVRKIRKDALGRIVHDD